MFKIISVVFLGLFYNINSNAQLLELPNFTDIPAAPNPPGQSYTEIESNSEDQRRVVLYDSTFNKRTVLPSGSLPQKSLADDLPDWGIGADSFDNHFLPNSENTPNGLPAPPIPYYETTAFPYRSIVKLVMRFHVDGEDFYYSCSGFMASYYHVVTAGHCIFNFDPNDDGSEADRKWADEIWAFPGQTDLVAPIQCGTNLCADWPYGVAKKVAMRSYTGWEIDHNFDHDWGVITLDRSIGYYTGYMGRSTDLPNSANYSGYPGEHPYVPEGINIQYRGYQQDNVVNSNGNIFELFAAIYGGHSGGPVWKFVNDTRYAVGIISNGNRSDLTYAVRLNDTKRASLNQWIADDATLYPPQIGGELIEFLFDGMPHKSIDKNIVGHNEQLTIDYSIHNIGFNNITRNIVISFYASDDEFTIADITDEKDPFNPYQYLLDQVVTDVDFAPDYLRNLSTTIQIPDTIPAGDYNLAITYQTIGEYPADLNCFGIGCTNKIIIPELPLAIEDCPSDNWEDDNSIAEASYSSQGSSRIHSICTIGDVDYVRIEVGGLLPVSAVFETVGLTGDTFLTLLLSNGDLIAFDNDSGVNQFSKITRTCGGTALQPGTYYLKVEEYGNDAIIERYDIQSSLTTCTDLLFQNGFELVINPN